MAPQGAVCFLGHQFVTSFIYLANLAIGCRGDAIRRLLGIGSARGTGIAGSRGVRALAAVFVAKSVAVCDAMDDSGLQHAW